MHPLSELGRITLIVIWIATGLALLSVLASLLEASLTKRRIRWDSYSTHSAFVIGILLVCQITWAIVVEGEGEKQTRLSHHQISVIAKSLLVNEALWTLANTLIRLSACSLLYRILKPVSGFRWAIIVLGCSTVAHGIASVLEVLLICRPLSAQWDSDATGMCGNQKMSFIAIESSGLVLDLAILLLPIQRLFGLHIPLQKKIAPFFILEIGVVLIVITVLRLKMLYLATSPDFVYAQSYLGLLSALGAMLGITLCSTMAYVKLWRMVKRRWRDRKDRSQATGTDFHLSKVVWTRRGEHNAPTLELENPQPISSITSSSTQISSLIPVPSFPPQLPPIAVYRLPLIPRGTHTLPF